MKSTNKRFALGVVGSALLIALAPQAAAQGASGTGDRYGAIAFTQRLDGGHAWGIAWDFESFENAATRAIAECESTPYGDGACMQVGWFRNACGALAVGGGNGFGAGWGDTMGLAERDALTQCGIANDGCRVLIGRCAEPDVVAGDAEDPNADSGNAGSGDANSRAGEVFRDCSGCPEMVVMPAGSFQMGCVSGVDCNDSEMPVHEVTIPAEFAVGKYEVTFDEWDACVAGSGCGGYDPRDEDGANRWGYGRRPVIWVSWDDAQEYLAWLSARTGQTYRLLTEAEWEYVARAGTTTAYSWGDEIGSNRANCNSSDLENPTCGDQYEYTAPVGSFPANAFGVHDMHGNVFEAVEDCWNDS